jgi:DNA-3-methyladenine glycosylase II
MKPTRYPTLFEGFVNAVACQQLTLSFGIQLINRIVHSFGPPKSPDGDTAHAFPRPDDVAWLEPAEFRALGFSHRKGETLIELAHAMLEGRLLPEELETLDDEAARNVLCSLHGIGRWSAEYILLRSLGRLNVFPGDDVGAQKNLQRWLQLPKQPDYQGVRKLLARWQPYGGLVYFHLLLERLAAAGLLSDVEF